jgi:single-strand DNA-binding protein
VALDVDTERDPCRDYPGTSVATGTTSFAFSPACLNELWRTMSDTITVTGLVATAPRHLVTSEGLQITSFRLASTQRRFDRSKERWIDAETNWYTISAFRQLAANAASSITKGERVLVTGRLRIREWENGERSGTTIEIEADAIGHDLSWGTTAFSRSITSSTPAESAGTDSAAEQSVVELVETVEARDEAAVPF